MKTFKKVKAELETYPRLAKKELSLSAVKGPDGEWAFEAILWFEHVEEAHKFRDWLEKHGWYYYIGPNNWRRFKIDVSPRGITPPSIN